MEQKEIPLTINPYFVTGFVDGEGCFSVFFRRDKRMKLGWVISLNFQIHLHSKDKELLSKIREVLGRVGGIYESKNNSCSYIVSSLPQIVNTLIPFFDKYPLLSKKSEDYEFFKKVALIMNKKEHLKDKGFYEILSIKAAMRNGLTEVLAESFPNIKPVSTSNFENLLPKSLNPHWIAGFTEAEGSFMIHTQKHLGSKLGQTVKLKFKISQHEKDKELLNLILYSLGCGTLVTSNINCKVVVVSKFEDIFNIIIPFFQKYPLYGDKNLNYLDFVKAAFLIKDKAHLTQEGWDKVLTLKSGMNYGRNYELKGE